MRGGGEGNEEENRGKAEQKRTTKVSSRGGCMVEIWKNAERRGGERRGEEGRGGE